MGKPREYLTQLEVMVGWISGARWGCKEGSTERGNVAGQGAAASTSHGGWLSTERAKELLKDRQSEPYTQRGRPRQRYED